MGNVQMEKKCIFRSRKEREGFAKFAKFGVKAPMSTQAYEHTNL